MLDPDLSRSLDDVGGVKLEPDLAEDVGVVLEGVLGRGHPRQDVAQNALLIAGQVKLSSDASTLSAISLLVCSQ